MVLNHKKYISCMKIIETFSRNKWGAQTRHNITYHRDQRHHIPETRLYLDRRETRQTRGQREQRLFLMKWVLVVVRLPTWLELSEQIFALDKSCPSARDISTLFIYLNIFRPSVWGRQGRGWSRSQSERWVMSAVPLDSWLLVSPDHYHQTQSPTPHFKRNLCPSERFQNRKGKSSGFHFYS